MVRLSVFEKKGKTQFVGVAELQPIPFSLDYNKLLN